MHVKFFFVYKFIKKNIFLVDQHFYTVYVGCRCTKSKIFSSRMIFTKNKLFDVHYFCFIKLQSRDLLK